MRQAGYQREHGVRPVDNKVIPIHDQGRNGPMVIRAAEDHVIGRATGRERQIRGRSELLECNGIEERERGLAILIALQPNDCASRCDAGHYKSGSQVDAAMCFLYGAPSCSTTVWLPNPLLAGTQPLEVPLSIRSGKHSNGTHSYGR